MQNILSKNNILFEASKDAFECDIFCVEKSCLMKTISAFKSEEFDMLLSVSAVDLGENFEVIYNLYSSKSNQKVIIKTLLEDRQNPCIESLCSLYSAANWHERECYDLMGVEFINHPDMKRILMPKDWLGYPLRKDYVLEDERLSWNKR